MKTVALIEYWWSGHNPGFFELYCRALLAAGCRVVAFCPEPETIRRCHPEACATGQLATEEITDEVQGHRWIRKVPQLAGAFRFKQQARRLARWEAENGCRVDLVFFACLFHGVAPWGGMDAIFPYPWTSLLLDSTAIRLRPGPRKWLYFRGFDALELFRARGCQSLATLDRAIAGSLGQRTGKPVHVLPESVDESPARADFPLAKTIRAQAAGRRVIGCYGLFAKRKGALGFLRLAEACRDEPWFFAWVGRLEENSFSAAELRWIRAYLASAPANCRVDFGRVETEPDFNALLSISDVLYLCYHQHAGSSNMMTKAAAFDKPVLVSDGYCMADCTRAYDLGLCVPEDDVLFACAAIARLLSGHPRLPTPRFAEYRAVNSPAAFDAAVRAMVGDAAAPGQRSVLSR